MMDTPRSLKAALVAVGAAALVAGCGGSTRGTATGNDAHGGMSGATTGTGLGSGTTEQEPGRKGAFDPAATRRTQDPTSDGGY